MHGRVILFHQSSVVLNGDQPFWARSELLVSSDNVVAELQLPDPQNPHTQTYSVVILASLEGLSGNHQLGRPRELLLSHGFQRFLPVGCASQWVTWYWQHQYCGGCGRKNQLHADARHMHCDHCERDYYPRISPCVIVLVARGEQVLLARSSRRGTSFFSCLAGFIEPGETAEEAVAREVYEEVGIRIHNVRYVRSQSWPFPSQLMLAFYADYADGQLQLDLAEIAEADWFDVEALPVVPDAKISVAGQLISDYCQHIRAVRGANQADTSLI